VQRVIAAMMLAWLGILFPLSGASASWCLQESRLLVGGKSECRMEKAASCQNCRSGKPKACCNEEKKGSDKPCCVDLEDLPNAPAPSVPEGLPAIAAIDLPPPVFVLPPAVLVEDSIFEAAVPILGPDSPAARRAKLEVWRL
jgi:hypothetical protein